MTPMAFLDRFVERGNGEPRIRSLLVLPNWRVAEAFMHEAKAHMRDNYRPDPVAMLISGPRREILHPSGANMLVRGIEHTEDVYSLAGRYVHMLGVSLRCQSKVHDYLQSILRSPDPDVKCEYNRIGDL